MIDSVFNEVSIALKSHWDMVLCDEAGKTMEWTKPLIKSTNAPRLKLLVENKDGGTRPAYTGFELPDALEIEMYETTDHKVEDYFESWHFGDKGVFNREKGVFRSPSTLDNIYRKIIFSTYRYKLEEDGDLPVAMKEAVSAIATILIKRYGESAGIKGVTEALIKDSEFRAMFTKGIINQQQIFTKITAVASEAVNQVTGKVSFATAGLLKVSPVVISPPTMKKVVSIPLVVPTKLNVPTAKVLSPSKLTPDEMRLLEGASERIQEQALKGIRKYKATETMTSQVTYTCILEEYSISSYDYEGGPVTLSVRLPIADYAKTKASDTAASVPFNFSGK